MFGQYLHAITAHSPTQYELSCLRSLNTENQERLFGQGTGVEDLCLWADMQKTLSGK